MTSQAVNALTFAENAPDSTNTPIRVSIAEMEEIYAQTQKHMDTADFIEWVQESVDYAEGYRQLAARYDVNPGLVYHVCQGHDSPTLRKAMGIPKHPKRDRLIINGCPPELKARFTTLCNEHGMTRLEMFAELVTFYEME